MANQLRWALFDLDGTLADTRHREPLALAQRWDEFNAAHPADPVRRAERELAWAWHNRVEGRYIVICTGRTENYRASTVDWLTKAMIPFDKLLMRPRGNTQADIIIKPALVFKYLGLSAIAFAVEDRERMVAKWRELGLTCFQSQLGAY